MADFKIYVEGKADKKFSADYIYRVFNIKFEDIVDVGGKDKWKEIASILQLNSASGKRNILIFDANGDVAERRKEILTKAVQLGIRIDDLFLLPNDSESGNLETLLLQLTNPVYNSFFDCFEGYKGCLLADTRYNIPDDKTKVYAYTFSILAKTKTDLANETKRDYLLADHWNLNHSSLEPLKTFLAKFFHS